MALTFSNHFCLTINNVKTKAHKMVMRLNNIYSSGDYFFLDFSVENKTDIPFDIDQIRLKLSDKKTTKATNSTDGRVASCLHLGADQAFPLWLPQRDSHSENDLPE